MRQSGSRSSSSSYSLRWRMLGSGRAELRPRDGLVAVEDEVGVGAVLVDEALLEPLVGLLGALLVSGHGVEPRAPAAAEDPVAPLAIAA